jgi:hypothetical protein
MYYRRQVYVKASDREFTRKEPQFSFPTPEFSIEKKVNIRYTSVVNGNSSADRQFTSRQEHI